MSNRQLIRWNGIVVKEIAFYGASLGCFKMHFNLLIRAIVFSSVPLGMLMNMCDFRKILKMFRPPLLRYIGWSHFQQVSPETCWKWNHRIYRSRGGLKIFGILRKSHMFISLPKGTDGKTMAFIK